MPRAKTAPPDTAEANAADPGLQKIVVLFAMGTIATVIGTALYGPDQNSERAFRLLHWWKRNAQPTPESPTPPARRRRTT